MTYPVNLVDIAGIAIAVGCLASALPDARREPRKLWRLGIPPLLGIVVATLILAGAAVSLAHDMTWIGTTFLGTFTGWLRGRRLAVETDQVWGLVRIPVTRDTSVAAAFILGIATIDGLSGLFTPGTLPGHARMAAACSLFAGYLAGRAWGLVGRAVRSPHVELETP